MNQVDIYRWIEKKSEDNPAQKPAPTFVSVSISRYSIGNYYAKQG